MKFAIVKEYLSAFSAQQPDVIVGVSETFSEAVEVAIKAFIADHPEQSANAIELAESANTTNKVKCEQYVLQIHNREQTIGYQGQEGHFSIVNAGADNVFVRLLNWVPTQPVAVAHTKVETTNSQQLAITTTAGVKFSECGDVRKKQHLFEVSAGADLGDALTKASDFLDMVSDPIFTAGMGQGALEGNAAWLVLHAIESAKAVIDSLVAAAENTEAAISGK